MRLKIQMKHVTKNPESLLEALDESIIDPESINGILSEI